MVSTPKSLDRTSNNRAALVTLNDCSENFDTASLPVDEAVSGQQNATVSNPPSSIPGVAAIGSPPVTLGDTEDMPIPSLQVVTTLLAPRPRMSPG